MTALAGKTDRSREAEAGGYRGALSQTAAAAAIPYGFTIMNAGAAGVLVHTHGAPTATGALLFVSGAIVAFTTMAILGGRPGRAGPHALPPDPRWVGACSGVAALTGFAAAALIADVVGGVLSFGAVSLTATVLYFGVGSLAAALVERWLDASVRQGIASAQEGERSVLLQPKG